ncbi:hypothetical protein VNO77_15410 [Canavalia gladiata]|uniref:Uncharacterized protein n=1 Tax=Canavalia gladiata TaxID=3824 RepID=A0AAN9M092_CANGL
MPRENNERRVEFVPLRQLDLYHSYFIHSNTDSNFSIIRLNSDSWPCSLDVPHRFMQPCRQIYALERSKLKHCMQVLKSSPFLMHGSYTTKHGNKKKRQLSLENELRHLATDVIFVGLIFQHS